MIHGWVGFFDITIQHFPHRRHNVNFVVSHPAQTFGQNLRFLVIRFVFVHDKDILALYLAQTAFDLDAGEAQVLFRHTDLEFFGQFNQFAIKEFGFHDKFYYKKFM